MGNAIRLFRVAGIQVSLHFSWFLVAIYQLTSRNHGYHSPVFAVYEYLGLFLIVLLHEFGHAFACRSVGGVANYILLWPFGGIAFVRPPPRPGAELWSIAAGPLVNVALVPILFFVHALAFKQGLPWSAPDFYRLIAGISGINVLILIFNLMPIYPLDGGQILRSLLWFPLGRIKSLRIASVIGLAGGIGLMLLAILAVLKYGSGNILFVFLTIFLVTQAMVGWRHAQLLQAQENEAARMIPPEAPQRPPIL
ncbi:MAG: site-2 protease family protein [Chthoniobacterales bacterium]